MVETSIRTTVAGDASMISAVVQRTVRLINSADYEPAIIDLICANFTMDKILEKMRERDMFSCFSDGRCVGTISLGGNKLHSLFVEPDVQRSGIGARLVAHLEHHALSKGLQELLLSSSITARSFYERLGYKILAFEDRKNGSTYLMSKHLQR